MLPSPTTPRLRCLLMDQGQVHAARASILSIAAPPHPSQGPSTMRPSDPKEP